MAFGSAVVREGWEGAFAAAGSIVVANALGALSPSEGRAWCRLVSCGWTKPKGNLYEMQGNKKGARRRPFWFSVVAVDQWLRRRPMISMPSAAKMPNRASLDQSEDAGT